MAEPNASVTYRVSDVLDRIESKIDVIAERIRLLELDNATHRAVNEAAGRAKAAIMRSRYAIWTACVALVTAAAAVAALFAH